jgi:hypothetical protein
MEMLIFCSELGYFFRRAKARADHHAPRLDRGRILEFRAKFAKGKRPMNESTQREKEREYPHWNRVYITVVIYSICLIVGLWLFSRMFQ